MMKERKEKLPTVVLIASVVIMLTIASTGSCQTGTRAVGIKAGDWVKYKVTRLGVSNLAWVGYSAAVWIKVEVLNVSGTTVTYRETIHYDDGDEYNRNCSWNVQSERDRPNCFIAADLMPGDKVGEYPILDYQKNKWVNVDLKLNGTEFRRYGGVTREVNPMKFSYVTPCDVYDVHFTLERYWDKHTGFLLEKKFQCYTLGYPERGYNETNPESTCKVDIADTNMWMMETERSFPWQPFAVAIPVGAIIAVAVTIKLWNNRKKKEVEER